MGRQLERPPDPRFLCVAPDSPTRLLRTAQTARCATCGNRIEWYYRPGERTIPLHPQELPAAAIAPNMRWHVNSGIAHPAGDGSPWCRVRHHTLCPATPAELPSSTLIDRLRRNLALNTRRLIDTGAFTPSPAHTEIQPSPISAPAARPVVQFLYVRYLAPSPLEKIPCVAQTRNRQRCPHPVLDPDALPGAWTLIPVHPDSSSPGQLPFTSPAMAVYDLNRVPYAEQLRWRAQRCSAHAAAPAAADMALTAWEPFNPRIHHRHIQHHLPDPPHSRPGRGRR
ncbi:DUF6083 domain-containing protein [Streptomyces netropsis]